MSQIILNEPLSACCGAKITSLELCGDCSEPTGAYVEAEPTIPEWKEPYMVAAWPPARESAKHVAGAIAGVVGLVVFYGIASVVEAVMGTK